MCNNVGCFNYVVCSELSYLSYFYEMNEDARVDIFCWYKMVKCYTINYGRSITLVQIGAMLAGGSVQAKWDVD
jgi:hypothetical protein